MGINIGSIAGKVKKFAESPAGKQKMAQAVQRIREGKGPSGNSGRTQAGDIVVTYEQMQEAAKDLISIIRRHAASANLPASVMAHIESFSDSPLVKHEDGSASIAINMLDDASRESVQPEKYDGAWNIVASFNAGYEAKRSAFGYWKSYEVYIRTKPQRDGLFFLQSAIAEFNGKYGKKYNVTVTLDNKYEKPN